jgi:hypothetical protein
VPTHLSASIDGLIPDDSWYVESVDKDGRAEKIAQATLDIISSFNDGVMISNYIGHGVVDRWSGSKGLFKQENVHTLSNEEQLAFALMLT